MDTGHLGNTLDIFTVLSLVLAIYSLISSYLSLANLTMIAVLLFLLLAKFSKVSRS